MTKLEVEGSESGVRMQGVALGALMALCTIFLTSGSAAAQGWDDRSRSSDWDRDRQEPSYDDRDSRYDDREPDRYDHRRGLGVRVGVGLTAGPDSFLMDFALPYYLGSGVSIGPRVQLGLDENETFLAPTLSIEYAHDLSRDVAGPLGKLRPLINIGAGFAWINQDGRAGDDSETGFLFDVGVGIAYPLSDQFEIASVVDFDILPRRVLGQDLVITWQALQMRVRF